MLGVAKGEGWDVERYDALFEEAVTKEPDFLGHYFDKANYMLPRWTGDPKALARFVDQSVARTKDPTEREAIDMLAGDLWDVAFVG